jgi:hypothetical protein
MAAALPTHSTPQPIRMTRVPFAKIQAMRELRTLQQHIRETGELTYVWNGQSYTSHLRDVTDSEAQTFLEHAPNLAILRTASHRTLDANPMAVAVIGYMGKNRNGSPDYRKRIVTVDMIHSKKDLHSLVDPAIAHVYTNWLEPESPNSFFDVESSVIKPGSVPRVEPGSVSRGGRHRSHRGKTKKGSSNRRGTRRRRHGKKTYRNRK